MSNEYFSFYEIAKELAFEDKMPYMEKIHGEIKILDDSKFKSYRETKQSYFENILNIKGINPNIKYKSAGKYKIPIEEKEVIKLIIKEYTYAYIKKLRKGRITTLEEVEEIINKSKEVIESNFEGTERENQLYYLYEVLEYNSRKTGKEVYDRITKMIKESIDYIKLDKKNNDKEKILEKNEQLASYENIDDMLNEIDYNELVDLVAPPKYRYLTDSDAEFLLKYFEQSLISVIISWNNLVDVYSEIREEEIEDEALESLNVDEYIESSYNYKVPELLLEESINILNKKSKEVLNLGKKPTEEEIKKLKDVLKSLKPNKE